MATRYFTRATFDFLKDLEENNNRDWFQENKHRYEQHVRDSSIRFITDFGRQRVLVHCHGVTLRFTAITTRNDTNIKTFGSQSFD